MWKIVASAVTGWDTLEFAVILLGLVMLGLIVWTITT